LDIVSFVKALIAGFLLMLAGASVRSHADTYTITLDPAARSEPATGRVMLLFITKHGRGWNGRDPIEAPFFEAPQPIASVAVKDLKPGDSVTMTGQTPAFPDSLDKLGGKVRVQAVLDVDQTERSFETGPGNVFSEVVEAELSADKDDAISIRLSNKAEEPARVDGPNLKWVRIKSKLLSDFYHRDVYHRAGVALPKGYDDPQNPRQQWPAVYVIPGFGGREEDAEEYALSLVTPGIEEFLPIAVYIVLDPESPLGHHGFADSDNNGPRTKALTAELIPYLESQFRLVPKAEARVLRGHSSGGWSAMWLQLNAPEAFGACWAISPDPVDFSAFQMTDLYSEPNVFENEEGQPQPSYRQWVAVDKMDVAMTVRQEGGMEMAIDPEGRSGQQWDAWDAVFSRKDPASGMPRRMFDRKTGVIDKSVLRDWSRYDISQVARKKWQVMGPVLMDRVRLYCGELDSFYLNRAVEKLKQVVEEQKQLFPDIKGATGEGFIEIVPEADHGSIIPKTHDQIVKQMRDYLIAHGLHDPVLNPNAPRARPNQDERSRDSQPAGQP
jgi:S-formylglutathione hydrolase FrmB